MKIICFYNTYPHQKQIFPHEEQPLFYLKPDTSILTNNRPFFVPEFTHNLHCQVELVLRIDKLGKYIQENYAHTYCHEIALGVNIFDKSIQAQCMEKGLPWEKSCVFENSTALSPFLPIENINQLKDLQFTLAKNNLEKHMGSTSTMLFSIKKLITYISTYFTLKTGDLIFTGSPIPSVPININDVIDVFMGDEKHMRFRIK